MEAAPSVHSQSKRTVLYFISKGKLHLVPVSVRLWASLDPFKKKGAALLFHRLMQKLLHLPFLQTELFFIGQHLPDAAAAFSKMPAGGPAFFRRVFHHLQKPPFRLTLPYFVHLKPYLLPRRSVFHGHNPIPDPDLSFIGKLHLFDYAFINLSFFHISLQQIQPSAPDKHRLEQRAAS